MFILKKNYNISVKFNFTINFGKKDINLCFYIDYKICLLF